MSQPAFGSKSKASGMSASANAKDALGKQARLAQILMKLRKKNRNKYTSGLSE